MNKDNNSPRDNAKPTGNMSAEESHEYARKFQEENFGAAINIGGGRADEADAVKQDSVQRANENSRGNSDSENSKK